MKVATRLCLLLGVIAFALIGRPSVGVGEYVKLKPVEFEFRLIRSIEWLVDRSDTIVMLKFRGRGNEGSEVLHSFKGDPASLTFPLKFKKPEGSPGRIFEFSKGGLRRICFIRDGGLLSQIDVGRPFLESGTDIRWAYRIMYGVTQYGDPINTEAELYNTIQQRIKEPPKATGLSKKQNKLGDLPKGNAYLRAPGDFCLDQDGGYNFYLQVPYDTDRRDHLIEVAKTSVNAQEVISVISQLSNFDDGGKAMEAIKMIALDETRVIAPSYFYYHRKDRLVGIETVRKLAWKTAFGEDSTFEKVP